jgi:hypothetical protein
MDPFSGAASVIGLLCLCGLIAALNTWVNRDYNNILDGKGMPDLHGRPQLGTEAIDNNGLARSLNGIASGVPPFSDVVPTKNEHST